MPRVPVYNMQGEQTGEMELPESVFGVEPNEPLMHQAVVMYLANRRQGTAATRTRGMVSGGGRKPWRQKHTGRARQGSIRAPHWKGGGTVFGPQPRSYRYAIPRKARRAALRSALSAKVRDGQLKVVEGLEFSEPRTREMRRLLEAIGLEGALVVTSDLKPNVYLSARNLPKVATAPVQDLNAYEVLAHKALLFEKAAVERAGEVLAG
ncbi:MAG: 50S ribosomal protein L4 [Firmicutes bacterium]|nr:50S ribosomal protein L4 [Bacillota bacterium]